MSIIARSKFGDCSNASCGAVNTQCVKVGKSLYCLKCRKSDKTKIQMTKASKQLVSRNLYKVQTKPLEAERAFIIQDLDQAISKVIRMMYSNLTGSVSCYTCNWTGNWKEADCGHYISRSIMALRWDLRNLRPQCKKCNQHLYGNIEVFATNLEKETKGIVELLLEESREPKKWDRSELKEMLISIRAKLKIIESKFK